MFMVIRRNQMMCDINPELRRRRVTPNDVLLSKAAIIDKVPEMFPVSPRVGRTVRGRL